MGILLFNQREALKGRTLRFERFLREVTPLIEADTAAGHEEPGYTPPKGVDSYEFWQHYIDGGGVNIEESVAAKVTFNANDIKRYWRPDPAFPDKPWKHPDTGAKAANGPQTLNSVLTNVWSKAKLQLDQLDLTRHWLKQMREELDAMIIRHNQTYDELQAAKERIKNLEATVADLRQQVQERDRKIRTIEAKNESLEQEIEDQKDDIARLEGDLEDSQQKYAILEHDYKDLARRAGLEPDDDDDDGDDTGEPPSEITPGRKGEILFVDKENHFVIVAIQAADLAKGAVLNSYAAGADGGGTATGKLRTRDVIEEQGKAVLDVVSNWGIQKGDEVIY